MLEVKPDEFLVGSGDGTVSLVKDMTYAKAKRQPPKGGTFASVKEPTDQVLKEVHSISKHTHHHELLQVAAGENFIQHNFADSQRQVFRICHVDSPLGRADSFSRLQIWGDLSDGAANFRVHCPVNMPHRLHQRRRIS